MAYAARPLDENTSAASHAVLTILIPFSIPLSIIAGTPLAPTLLGQTVSRQNHPAGEAPR
nr:hypothetical protein [Escherichia coli]